jgi:tetratricopeptide (TPR) repeat protein
MLQQKIPDTAKDAYDKAVVHHREGKLDEALIEYGKALRSFPRYVAALTDIGTIFLLYNRPDSALAFLRRAEAEDDDDPIIQLNIAVALTEQANYSGALKLLKNVLQHEPRLAVAHYLAGKIHALQKKHDLAEQHLRQALEADPGMLDAAVLRINLSIEQNNFEEARKELQRIREAMRNQQLARFIDEQLTSLGG